jgi:hypothetical protein
MLSGTDPQGYELAPLREGVEFTLYPGRQERNQSPVLVMALAAEYPSRQSLRRLEHEYSFVAEVDPAWAAKPLALARSRRASESAPCNYGLMSAATSLRLKIGGDTEFLPYSCFL